MNPLENVKEIPLTQGRVALVDAEDYDELSRYKWQARQDRHTNKYYATRSSYLNPMTLKRHVVRMHRVIMNTPEGMVTDHINGDSLDNRRSNLRICTNSENLCNRGKPRANKSGFKGVMFYKSLSKWMAQIKIKGKKIHLGYFSTPTVAYEAYREACKKYHGDYANTGEPVTTLQEGIEGIKNNQ